MVAVVKPARTQLKDGPAGPGLRERAAILLGTAVEHVLDDALIGVVKRSLGSAKHVDGSERTWRRSSGVLRAEQLGSGLTVNPSNLVSILSM